MFQKSHAEQQIAVGGEGPIIRRNELFQSIRCRAQNAHRSQNLFFVIYRAFGDVRHLVHTVQSLFKFLQRLVRLCRERRDLAQHIFFIGTIKVCGYRSFGKNGVAEHLAVFAHCRQNFLFRHIHFSKHQLLH